MSEPLEELRAQRALIQKHLDWLDAQIAVAEGSSAEWTHSRTEQPAATAPAFSAADRAPTGSVPPVAETPKATDTPAVPYFDIDKDAHSSTTSDIRKAQVGCLIFFAIGVLGFLFLLFGLPNLVD
jgi:hypothetical protein